MNPVLFKAIVKFCTTNQLFTLVQEKLLLIILVVTSFDGALYDDYLCLVASNKQQIYVEISPPENLENG